MADIHYIPTLEGWLYLAVVEDLLSRRVVSWSMADSMGSRLVVDAWKWHSGEGVLAHLDGGSQYASEHYQLFLGNYRIERSMGGVGQCGDYATAESIPRV